MMIILLLLIIIILTTWLQNAVAKVERAAVAVLLKHNQLINEAMTFALWLTNNPSALEVADKAPLPPSLQMVWEVAYEVRSWLVQQQHKRRLAHKEGDAEIRFRLPQPRLIPLTVPHSKGFSLTCVWVPPVFGFQRKRGVRASVRPRA